MEYRILGKTGLRVSEIGYGAAQIGNINLPESQADRSLNAVLDAGINFIDTAAMYGQSEARIGKFISHRREEFVLATKCGDYVAESNGKRGIVRDYSRDGILRTIDDSRKKLDMDVIDIVQFHGLPEPADDEQVAFEALLDAREKGWTRFIGVSADGPSAAAAARRWDLDTQEFTYNILYQESAENLMPTLRSLGMGTIIKRPISNAVWEKTANDPMATTWADPGTGRKPSPLPNWRARCPFSNSSCVSRSRIRTSAPPSSAPRIPITSAPTSGSPTVTPCPTMSFKRQRRRFNRDSPVESVRYCNL